MKPIRVLYVHGGLLARGGTESYMMNYYRNIDRDKVQFDFIVHGFEKGEYDEEILSLGGKIYNVPIKKENIFKNIKEIKRIIKEGNYKIVHSHMDEMNMLILKIAKQCGVPIRIAHSHNSANVVTNALRGTYYEYAKKNIKKYATHCIACSEKAGRWLFGDDYFEAGNVMLINNAIDINNFKFNLEERSKFRKELNLDDNFLITNIGRFHIQKNHTFLLDIFKEVKKYIPNAKLVLLGDGELRKEIVNKVDNLGLKEDVVLLGVRDDINRIINAFDLFLFPSLYEGLPVVCVETQVNGLPSLVSDNISKEVKLNEYLELKSIKDSANEWANKIEQMSKSDLGRGNLIDIDKYDINKQAIKLQELYINLYNSVER